MVENTFAARTTDFFIIFFYGTILFQKLCHEKTNWCQCRKEIVLGSCLGDALNKKTEDVAGYSPSLANRNMF